MSNRNNCLTRGGLCQLLENEAKDYRKGCKASLLRNTHMHECSKKNIGKADPALIDAILVDFINHVAVGQCLDLALHTFHLKEEKNEG